MDQVGRPPFPVHVLQEFGQGREYRCLEVTPGSRLVEELRMRNRAKVCRSPTLHDHGNDALVSAAGSVMPPSGHHLCAALLLVDRHVIDWAIPDIDILLVPLSPSRVAGWLSEPISSVDCERSQIPRFPCLLVHQAMYNVNPLAERTRWVFRRWCRRIPCGLGRRTRARRRWILG